MKIFIPSRNLILATTIFLVFIAPIKSQDSPEDFLAAHNEARAAVGVGHLTWDVRKSDYDYNSNTCADPLTNCLSYTQVVWRNSVKLGCAKVSCINDGGTYITCNYDPPANNDWFVWSRRLLYHIYACVSIME
ncbi:hypothetical protein HID58_057123 [Brassica napus]|uniref:SCP domain-containing protein n=1 Tax=Brassica napus TaxID=3708 RepID=A0ABQ8AQ78_BRANA|nr:hypothetical protein HID58_057123 [Brassica napus]